jgi:hypothetical protein
MGILILWICCLLCILYHYAGFRSEKVDEWFKIMVRTPGEECWYMCIENIKINPLWKVMEHLILFPVYNILYVERQFIIFILFFKNNGIAYLHSIYTQSIFLKHFCDSDFYIWMGYSVQLCSNQWILRI